MRKVIKTQDLRAIVSRPQASKGLCSFHMKGEPANDESLPGLEVEARRAVPLPPCRQSRHYANDNSLGCGGQMCFSKESSNFSMKPKSGLLRMVMDDKDD